MDSTILPSLFHLKVLILQYFFGRSIVPIAVFF
uniref:Uncharacterized protein n=1 Tax=Rhizophora mucronata TaxID=61149 RepID=A0A2P2N9B9_RHIMU